MSKRNLSKPGQYSFTKFYTYNKSTGALTTPGWPAFFSVTGIVAAGKKPLTQSQSFNSFVDSIYKRLNEEHLEILEGFNDTETEQILYYTHNSSQGRLEAPVSGWPAFASLAGTIAVGITQHGSFNSFLEKLYEKYNQEHLEILEGFNDTETEQIW
ncbi:739_t:CDS:2, partial [Cetraspora pellucida]